MNIPKHFFLYSAYYKTFCRQIRRLPAKCCQSGHCRLGWGIRVPDIRTRTGIIRTQPGPGPDPDPVGTSLTIILQGQIWTIGNFPLIVPCVWVRQYCENFTPRKYSLRYSGALYVECTYVCRAVWHNTSIEWTGCHTAQELVLAETVKSLHLWVLHGCRVVDQYHSCIGSHNLPW